MSLNGRTAIIKIWRGIYVKYVKYVKPDLQRTMRSLSMLSPLIYVLVLVLVFCEAVVSDDSCFCDFGCFKQDFQYLCCDEICKDVDSPRADSNCQEQCPGYAGIVKLKKKIEDSNEDKVHKIKYWKSISDELQKRLNTSQENLISTRAELRRLKDKLRDLESSGRLLSGLATPLCLFGALIIILVVCVCLYQNSEVCKRKPMVHKNIEGSNEGYGGFGIPRSDSSFLAMKPSALDSVLSQHRSDKPPEYFSGDKVGRVPSRHSQNDTGVVMPCVACNQTPTASLEQYTRGNFQNFPVTLQQQVPQRQQIQSQQHHLTYPLQKLQFRANNQTQSDNVALANQLKAHQLKHRELAELGSDNDQARRSEKNGRTHDEAESCAFRLAQLDFNHEQQQSSKQPQRAKNNSLATAIFNYQYEADSASQCT